jgi:hypothetical protein
VNVSQRVLVGFQLTSHALRSWGTDRFWSLICWWHEETHYTIPQIEEEKRIAFELERSFTGNSVLRVGDCIGIGTTLPSTMLSVVDSPFAGLSLNPPGAAVGKWRWENVEIGTSTEPVRLRKLLVWVVTGAKWIRNEKSEGPALAPEYDRLSEFLNQKT